jgi:oligoribonuclease NrnB/cAMP/cGMP phosphodiesterase (DHH superfamily)
MQVPQFEVILGHGPGCPDGAAALWCYYRTLDPNYLDQLATFGGFYANPNIQVFNASQYNYIHPNDPAGAIQMQELGMPIVFVFLQPCMPVPKELVFNKKVLILDLDMGDNLVDVVSWSEYVTLIDHHISTQNTLNKYNDKLYIDFQRKFRTYVNTTVNESACTLTWKYFYQDPIPEMLNIIRIGDNWQWDDDQDAKHILKAMKLNRTFRSFYDLEIMYQNWYNEINSLIQQGQIIEEYENKLITEIVEQAQIGQIIADDKVYTIAYVQCNVLHSEVGAALKDYVLRLFEVEVQFCATWKYVSFNKTVSVSLRDADLGINLSTIARTVKGSNGKGGGHCGAASFVILGLENLPKVIKRISNNLSNYDDFSSDDKQFNKIINAYEQGLIKKITKQCDLGYLLVGNTAYTITYVQNNISSDFTKALIKAAELRFKIQIHLCVTWKYLANIDTCVFKVTSNNNYDLKSIAKYYDPKTRNNTFKIKGLDNFHKTILRINPLI